MPKEVIYATVDEGTIKEVKKLAHPDNENRSFSAMVDILLKEAVKARNGKKKK